MMAVRIHRFGPPERMNLEEVPRPSPAKNEVLIQVKAAGINPVDTYIRSGSFYMEPPMPAILGKEVAGVVVETGHEVTKFQMPCGIHSDVKNVRSPYSLGAEILFQSGERSAEGVTIHCSWPISVGDRVFCCLPNDGGYAEYAVCSSSHAFPLTEDLSFEQGAGLYVAYFTAYRALAVKLKVQKGESLLIHGASGAVGIAALQLAKHLGLIVSGTAGSQNGLDLLRMLRADYVYNHREDDYLYNAVTEATNSSGFNVILENLADQNLGADIAALNSHGRIAIVGSRGQVEINPRSIISSEGSIVGVNLFGMSEEDFQTCSCLVLKGVEEGWLWPVIARTYKLAEAPQAHIDIMDTKKGSKGKLVFVV